MKLGMEERTLKGSKKLSVLDGSFKNITAAARAESGATFDHKFSGAVRISPYDRRRGVTPQVLPSSALMLL